MGKQIAAEQGRRLELPEKAAVWEGVSAEGHPVRSGGITSLSSRPRIREVELGANLGAHRYQKRRRTRKEKKKKGKKILGLSPHLVQVPLRGRTANRGAGRGCGSGRSQ